MAVFHEQEIEKAKDCACGRFAFRTSLGKNVFAESFVTLLRMYCAFPTSPSHCFPAYQAPNLAVGHVSVPHPEDKSVETQITN